MKRIFSLLLLLILCLGLCSCDIVKPVSEIDPNKPDAPSGNTDDIKPVSDPADPKWSWGYSDTPLGDLWYENGKTTGEFFSVYYDGKGIPSLSFFDAGSEASLDAASSEGSFSITEKHVINEPGAEKEFDLIFLDPLTAYDSVSGSYYLRGDYVSLFDALTTGGFRSSLYPQEYIVLHSDGSAEDFYEGDPFTGTWYVENARQLVYHDDEYDTDYVFFFSFDDTGSLSGLISSAGEMWEPFSV